MSLFKKIAKVTKKAAKVGIAPVKFATVDQAKFIVRTAKNPKKALKKLRTTVSDPKKALAAVLHEPMKAAKMCKDAAQTTVELAKVGRAALKNPYVRTGVSVGIAAFCPPAGAAAYALLQKADVALEQVSKAEGTVRSGAALFGQAENIVTALDSKTKKKKAAAKKLVEQTAKEAKAGNKDAGRGLEALAVVRKTKQAATAHGKTFSTKVSTSTGILCGVGGKKRSRGTHKPGKKSGVVLTNDGRVLIGKWAA